MTPTNQNAGNETANKNTENYTASFESVSDDQLVVAVDTDPQSADRSNKNIPFVISKYGLKMLKENAVANKQSPDRFLYKGVYDKNNPNQTKVDSAPKNPQVKAQPQIQQDNTGLKSSHEMAPNDAITHLNTLNSHDDVNNFLAKENRVTVKDAGIARTGTFTPAK